MFTLQVKFKNNINKKEYSKFYCKKRKKFFVLSNNIECALLFKSIGYAKRSYNRLYKSQYLNKNRDIIGYTIAIKEN